MRKAAGNPAADADTCELAMRELQRALAPLMEAAVNGLAYANTPQELEVFGQLVNAGALEFQVNADWPVTRLLFAVRPRANAQAPWLEFAEVHCGHGGPRAN